MDAPGSAKEYALKFEKLLDMYPRPDGGRWRGVDFQEATNGFVSKSYITGLQKARWDNPGIAKLETISRVMGFPFRLWLEPVHNWEMVLEEDSDEENGKEFASLLNGLLDSRTNPRTGEPYTNRELSLATHGKVSEEEITLMRNGQLENPSREELIALSDALGVDPAYWFKRPQGSYLLDPSTYEAAQENELLLKRSLSLSGEDKELVMGLLEKLNKASESEEDSE